MHARRKDTVAQVLLGGDRIEPCPVCKVEGLRFSALDRVGDCYGCGKVDLERLFGLIYRAQLEDSLVPMDRSDRVQQGSKVNTGKNRQ